MVSIVFLGFSFWAVFLLSMNIPNVCYVMLHFSPVSTSKKKRIFYVRVGSRFFLFKIIWQSYFQNLLLFDRQYNLQSSTMELNKLNILAASLPLITYTHTTCILSNNSLDSHSATYFPTAKVNIC